jgi:hypothetical protein
MISSAFFGSNTVDLRVCRAICSVMLISIFTGVVRPPERDGGAGVGEPSSMDLVEERRCADAGNEAQLVLLFPTGTTECRVSRIAPVDDILDGGITTGEEPRAVPESVMVTPLMKSSLGLDSGATV